MKLDRITFRRLFPTGAYANESIELSGTLEENEDVMNAYTQLYNMVKELHHSQNKEFYEQTGTQVRSVETVVDTAEIDNEYKDVEEKLIGFQFKEDAEEYLLTTSFKHFVPAKKIVNSKPNK